MSICVLTSEDLSINILPENGGAITAAFYKGENFFFQPPHSASAPTELGDESDWVKAWNGGWQPLLPNAGKEYLDGEFPQGFHGNASQAPWQIEDQREKSLTLTWRDENLYSKRKISIDNGEISVSGFLENLDTKLRPFIVTEHLVLGAEFFNSEISLHPSSGAMFRELAFDGSINGQDSQPWKNFADEGWAHVTKGVPARMGVFSGISSFKVMNDKYEIDISWNSRNLPYLWLWQEMGTSLDFPWLGEYFALGVEPSNAPDGTGIGGDSIQTLKVNEKFNWSVNLHIQKRASK